MRYEDLQGHPIRPLYECAVIQDDIGNAIGSRRFSEVANDVELGELDH